MSENLTVQDNPISTGQLNAILSKYGRGVPTDVPLPAEPVYEPARIAKREKFVFRSRTGTLAAHAIRIPTIPPMAQSQDEKKYELQVARLRRKYTPAQIEYAERLLAKVGGHYVRFTTHEVRIPGDERARKTRECSYQTSDPEVAAFVRAAIKKDKRLYEDIQPLTITVGGRRIAVNVGSAEEREALAAAFAAGDAEVMAAFAEADEAVAVPLDKNGKPLRGVALAAWQRKHGAAG